MPDRRTITCVFCEKKCVFWVINGRCSGHIALWKRGAQTVSAMHSGKKTQLIKHRRTVSTWTVLDESNRWQESTGIVAVPTSLGAKRCADVLYQRTVEQLFEALSRSLTRDASNDRIQFAQFQFVQCEYVSAGDHNSTGDPLFRPSCAVRYLIAV